VVEDTKGQPIRDLAPTEVVVRQEGVPQRLTGFLAKDTPGHYEVRYVPESGKPGAVLVRLLRPGTRAVGPDGGGLKPHVLRPTSQLEIALTQVLEARPEAADFPAFASAMPFGADKDQVRHALAVEVPLQGLIAVGTSPPVVRLQILVRLRDAANGRVLQTFELDRSIPTPVGPNHLVWTGQVLLKSGGYVMEAVAYEPKEGRASVQLFPFDAPKPTPGLRLGSVALLQPMGNMVTRERGGEADDPFVVGSEPVMPTLALETAAAPGVTVSFYTIVYPDRVSQDPVTLRLDVLRTGKVVQSTPLPLPAPDDKGEIRYAGGFPTSGLEPAGLPHPPRGPAGPRCEERRSGL